MVYLKFLNIDSDYNQSKYVIIPAPMDIGSSWGVGSRFGPSSIIETSRYMDLYDMDLDLALDSIYTMEEIEPTIEMTKNLDLVESTVSEVLSHGKVPVLIGGDHSISIASAKASFLHGAHIYIAIDAHADLYDEYNGSKLSHACVTRRILDLPVEKAVLIGVRTMGLEEVDIARRDGRVAIVRSSSDLGILDSLKGEKAHLSFDVDVMDPSIIPCVGCPEPGGISYRDAIAILRAIFEKVDVISMDFVEFSPCQGRKDDAFTVAKLIYKSILMHYMSHFY
ncbi:MAG: agmatinase [Candidatus Methanodesulfokora sp.]|jgi:agmatinase